MFEELSGNKPLLWIAAVIIILFLIFLIIMSISIAEGK